MNKYDYGMVKWEEDGRRTTPVTIGHQLWITRLITLASQDCVLGIAPSDPDSRATSAVETETREPLPYFVPVWQCQA